MLQRSKNPDLSINKFYWHCQGHILCLSTHLFVKNLVCEASLCLIQDQSTFSEEKWTIKYVNMSLLQHCLSQQLRRNSTSYKKKNKVKNTSLWNKNPFKYISHYIHAKCRPDEKFIGKETNNNCNETMLIYIFNEWDLYLSVLS